MNIGGFKHFRLETRMMLRDCLTCVPSTIYLLPGNFERGIMPSWPNYLPLPPNMHYTKTYTGAVAERGQLGSQASFLGYTPYHWDYQSQFG